MADEQEEPERLWVEAPDTLEFWCSEGWVDIWAGATVLRPPPGSAAGLVRAALLPGSNVNFPQITEICERTISQPQELEGAVRLLVAALRDRYADFRKKLKALTISNEMMYDDTAVAYFQACFGLSETLTALRGARGSPLGAAMDENIRMLATEIDKTCFSEGGVARPHKTGLSSRLSSAMKSGVGAAANKWRSDRPETSSSAFGVENAFYYDHALGKWCQKGVPNSSPKGSPRWNEGSAPDVAKPPSAATPLLAETRAEMSNPAAALMQPPPPGTLTSPFAPAIGAAAAPPAGTLFSPFATAAGGVAAPPAGTLTSPFAQAPAGGAAPKQSPFAPPARVTEVSEPAAPPTSAASPPKAPTSPFGVNLPLGAPPWAAPPAAAPPTIEPSVAEAFGLYTAEVPQPQSPPQIWSPPQVSAPWSTPAGAGTQPSGEAAVNPSVAEAFGLSSSFDAPPSTNWTAPSASSGVDLGGAMEPSVAEAFGLSSSFDAPPMPTGPPPAVQTSSAVASGLATMEPLVAEAFGLSSLGSPPIPPGPQPVQAPASAPTAAAPFSPNGAAQPNYGNVEPSVAEAFGWSSFDAPPIPPGP
eukprot:CAMPEP_0203856284 /NCGR_PEP_ID=MMETSP0359-20131031/10089_2 /ASSEMBLY_ACC=CAM_ASM_000338 /TAXON_ID=268821 /ORGANISM="Scrippsiella Hangoei, Strain SHTV-5" /LENGTH=585 /DNA_ID=CAMNT_0050772877 /DNA_START=86 /DNA_END=1839 /DNA_ORIENTATION=-